MVCFVCFGSRLFLIRTDAPLKASMVEWFRKRFVTMEFIKVSSLAPSMDPRWKLSEASRTSGVLCFLFLAVKYVLLQPVEVGDGVVCLHLGAFGTGVAVFLRCGCDEDPLVLQSSCGGLFDFIAGKALAWFLKSGIIQCVSSLGGKLAANCFLPLSFGGQLAKINKSRNVVEADSEGSEAGVCSKAATPMASVKEGSEADVDMSSPVPQKFEDDNEVDDGSDSGGSDEDSGVSENNNEGEVGNHGTPLVQVSLAKRKTNAPGVFSSTEVKDVGDFETIVANDTKKGMTLKPSSVSDDEEDVPDEGANDLPEEKGEILDEIGTKVNLSISEVNDPDSVLFSDVACGMVESMSYCGSEGKQLGDSCSDTSLALQVLDKVSDRKSIKDFVNLDNVVVCPFGRVNDLEKQIGHELGISRHPLQVFENLPPPYPVGREDGQRWVDCAGGGVEECTKEGNVKCAGGESEEPSNHVPQGVGKMSETYFKEPTVAKEHSRQGDMFGSKTWANIVGSNSGPKHYDGITRLNQRGLLGKLDYIFLDYIKPREIFFFLDN
ncbi:hypothetical protein U1Q18_003326 [Sarracenia purpurea var. burkii]